MDSVLLEMEMHRRMSMDLSMLNGIFNLANDYDPCLLALNRLKLIVLCGQVTLI